MQKLKTLRFGLLFGLVGGLVATAAVLITPCLAWAQGAANTPCIPMQSFNDPQDRSDARQTLRELEAAVATSRRTQKRLQRRDRQLGIQISRARSASIRKRLEGQAGTIRSRLMRVKRVLPMLARQASQLRRDLTCVRSSGPRP